MLISEMKSNLDKGFRNNEIKILTEYKLVLPSEVLKGSIEGNNNIDHYDANIGELLKTLGQKKDLSQKVKQNQKIWIKLIN